MKRAPQLDDLLAEQGPTLPDWVIDRRPPVADFVITEGCMTQMQVYHPERREWRELHFGLPPSWRSDEKYGLSIVQVIPMDNGNIYRNLLWFYAEDEQGLPGLVERANSGLLDLKSEGWRVTRLFVAA